MVAVKNRPCRDFPLKTADGKYEEGVVLDLDWQPRMGTKDVGADEYSTAPILRRPLQPADVGPAAF